MKNMGLGLQLYSVREALSKDEWETVRRVAEIGYQQVELCAPGFENGRPAPATPASEAQKRYRDLNLRLISIAMSANDPSELEKWKRLTEYSGEIGCEGICCSIAMFESPEAVKRMAEFFNAVGRFASENGQRFYYHNHYHEFQRMGEKRVMELLVELTDPRYVDFELDTFWALRGGVEPVAFMEALGERLRLIHQKDLSAHIQPVNLFERIPQDQVIDWDVFGKYARDPSAFKELGRGVMDVRAIIEKAEGMPSVLSTIIEQDATAVGEFESARINYEYMQQLLNQEEK